MLKFVAKGDFKNTERFLGRMMNRVYLKKLEYYGQKGVEALASATPRDTGTTAASWAYKIEDDGKSVRLVWTNSNRSNGVPIAILIQYGHATRNGGFVQGRDYINPALRPIFDDMAQSAWKEVTNS